MKPWDKDWASTDSATPKAKTPAPAATVPWNKDWSGVQSTAPSKLSQPPAPERNTGAGGDLMTDVKRGALDIPSALTGIADIAPALAGAGTPVSDFFEDVGKESGFEPGKWSEEAKKEYSPERVATKAKLDKAWDEGSAKDVAVQMLAHPVHNIGGLVAESLPATLAGGGVGKAAMMAGRAVLPKAAAAISPKAAAVAGGAVGEGAIGAGSAMADFEGEDTQRGAVAALGSGAITGLLGAAGGKVAQKIGLADVDTLFTGGLKSLDTKTQRGIMKRIAAGATAEGVLEELPQSLQEYAWSQWGQDKPVDVKGLARAGVEGLAAGAVMGGGAAGLFKPDQAITPPPPPDTVNPPPTDPQAGTVHPITGELIPALPTPPPGVAPLQQELLSLPAFGDMPDSIGPDFIQPEGGPMLTPEQAANPPAPGFVEAGIGAPTPPPGPMAKAVARLPAPPAPPIEGQGQTETMPVIEAGQADTTDQDIAEDLDFLEGFDLSEQDLDKGVVDDMAILDSFIEAAPTKKKQTERLVERNLDTGRGPVSTEGIEKAETAEFEEIEAAPAPLARPGTEGIEVDQTKTQDVETVSAKPKQPTAEGIDVQEQTGTVENLELAPPPKAPTNKKELAAAANEASTSPTNEMVQPSEAQIRAGNYKKGHVQIQGLDISIENPRGSTRSGKDKDGTQWNQLMKDHYGYIKGTVGKDKDHIDVFLGDLAHSENAPVFVVDQVDPETGKFDEHKVMMGYPSKAYARRAYNSNYAPGWNGAGEITKVSQADFKAWLASGKTKKPFALEEKAEAEGPNAASGEFASMASKYKAQYAFEAALIKKYGRPIVEPMIKSGQTTSMWEERNKPAPLTSPQDQAAAKAVADAEAAEAKERVEKEKQTVAEANRLADEKKAKRKAAAEKRKAKSNAEAESRLKKEKEHNEKVRAAWDKFNEHTRPKHMMTEPGWAIVDKATGEANIWFNGPPKETRIKGADIVSGDKFDLFKKYIYKETPSSETKAETKETAESKTPGFDVGTEVKLANEAIPEGYEITAFGKAVGASRRGANGKSVGNVGSQHDQTAEGIAELIKQVKLFDANAKALQQEVYSGPAMSEPVLEASGDPKAFKTELTKAVTDWVHVEIGRRIDSVTATDPQSKREFEEISRQLDGFTTVVSSNGKELDPGTYDAKTIEAMRKEAQGRKVRQDAAKRKKEHEVVIAEAAVAAFTALPPGGYLPSFTVGWDHALRGGSKSGIDKSSEHAKDTQAGYDAAQKWLATKDGQAFRAGKTARKMKGTGEQLKRRGDRLKAIKTDDATKFVDELIKATNRAQFFTPGEGATPGSMKMLDMFRARAKTFQEYWAQEARADENIGSKRWQVTAKEAITERASTEKGRDELRSAAEDYIEHGEFFSPLSGHASVAALGAAYNKMQHEAAKTTDRDFKAWRVLDLGSFRLTGLAPGGYDYNQLEKHENDPTVGGSRKKKLMRPKLDRVDRQKLPDYRKGRDISAQTLETTFGLGGVTYGKSVTGQQRKDHTNYAYDALNDLAALLKIKPKEIGFDGKLYLAFGALGRGRHAAHYQPMHALEEGGTVPAINLTNTKGDGSLAHEWFHAFDWNQRQNLTGGSDAQEGAVRSVLTVLKYTFPTEDVLRKHLMLFLKGQTHWSGGKRDGEKESGKQFLERAKRNFERLATHGSTGDMWAGPSRTQYWAHANKLGKDYWGNQAELFARAGESYVYDQLDGRSNYLVNDWVEAEAVMAPQYRGKPYPGKAERDLFNEAFNRLFHGSQTDKDMNSLAGELGRDRADIAQRLLDELDTIYANLQAEKTKPPTESTLSSDDYIEESENPTPPQNPTPKPPPSKDTKLSADELADMFDEVLDEETEASQEDDRGGTTPEPTPDPKESTNPVLVDDPHQGIRRLVRTLEKHDFHEIPMDWRRLFSLADEAFEGTQAEGAYTPKDAYDALETALNKQFGQIGMPVSVNAEGLNWLGQLQNNLPTQTKRTKEQDEFQQYSTPYAHGAIMVHVANLRSNDVLLEPSAGTGNLAAMAVAGGQIDWDRVVANELSPRRAELVEEAGAVHVYRENAEQLNNIIGKDVQPTVVIMNPPFSATAGRTNKRDQKTAQKHIDQAFSMLAPGGRLVALVGKGMTFNANTHKAWWDKKFDQYQVRANIGINGKEYTKFGTSFDNRLLVIDKIPPATGTLPVEGEDLTVAEVLPLLEEIRNERVYSGEQIPAESGSAEVAGTGRISESKQGSSAAAGGVGTGGSATERGSVPGEGGTVRGDSGTGSSDTSGRNERAGGKGSGRKRDTGKRGPGGTKPKGGVKGGAKSTTKSDRELKDIASSFAQNGVKGVDEAISGLYELFGGGALKSFPGGIDEKTYQKAKPHFQAMADKFLAAGNDIKEFFRALIKQFGGGIKPYAVRFVMEYQDEVAKTGESPNPVDTAPTEDVPEQDTDEPEELGDGRYSTYKPQRVFRKGKPHPGKLVESSAMASVDAPPIKKAPKLPAGVVAQGKLSDAQLFGVAAANQAHAQILPNGERLGYFFGDGTGVGKGREIVGTIVNNMMDGRKKAVWVSVNFDLFSSAQRDYSNVMGNSDALFEGGGAKMKLDNIIERDEGVMFTTYNTLTSKRAAKGDREERSRLDQMVEWLGEDFDGVIAFDESHLMGNSISVKGERGTSKPSKRALIGMELQAKLPKARILYVSATGATEVHNLGYADRLGLWGEGTAFPSKQEFFTSMNNGGLAAMEVVAKDLKASGKYQARSLSFDDVTYGKLEHALDNDQTKMYNKVAKAWQVVLNNVHAALEMTEGQKDSDARRGSLGQFWGAHQRFFNQVITSMQMPSVIESIKADLAAGRSPVIQLVNTYEAAQKRAVQDMQATGGNLDDLDITPKQGLMQYIEKSFPVHQYEEYTDKKKNTQTRPVLSASTEHTDPITGEKTITPGDPVENADAVALREKILNELSLLRVPEGPLDVLLSEFGPETVAEVTGRKKRYYLKEDENGERVRVEESVSKSSMQQDAKDYMADKKRILVFSYAGGTGASYNADLDSKNQRKRVHYLLQPGWRADLAIQGLGRSHRSHQKQAPHVVLVSTNLRGHRRFIASIARRMDQLGALTKGQRDTGGQGIFSAEYNLETEYSEAAIESLITKVRAGEIEGVTTDTFIHDMGLGKRDKDGNITGFDTPSVPHFLNRILSLKVDDQALVFDSFFEILQDVIQTAAENGTLDVGMETLQADRIEVKNEQVLRTDETTGAQTKYAELNLYEKIVPLEFDKLLQATAAGGAEIQMFAKNKRSGKVYAFIPTVNRTLSSGQVVRQLRRVGAVSTTKVTAEDIGDPTKPQNYYTRQARAKWDYVSEAEARELWAEDVRTAPTERMKKKHFITGTLLPVWDRLPQSMVRIMRAQLDNGKMMVGRMISQKELDPTLKALGAQSRWKNTSNKELLSMVIDKGAAVVLSNRWRLDRRMVSGENRIELTGWTGQGVAKLDQLQEQGAIFERIAYQGRLFIPTGAKGVEVMDRIMLGKDVTEVVLPKSAQAESEEGEEIYQRAQSKGTGENEPPANQHADLNNMVKLREAVGRFLGKASLAQLEATKRVRLVQSSSDLPGNQPANTRGIWDGRSIWLVADHLGPLKHTVAEAILLHEGEHAGMKNLLGNSYRGIQNRFDDLLRNGDPAAESAMGRVTRDTLPEHVEAERLAYFIEEAYLRQSRGENLGGQAATLLREILNAIKAWFRATDFGKMLAEQGVEFKLTDDFAIALAKRALKQSTTPPKPPGGGRRPMGTPVGQMEQRSQGSAAQDATMEEAFARAGLGKDTRTLGEKLKDSIGHGFKENAETLKERVLEGTFDQFHGIKRAIESFRGVLPAELDGYIAARLSTGLPSTLYAAMRYGAPEWRDGVLSKKPDSKGLLQILDPIKKDQRAFFGWMVGRRAQRLKGEDKENNLSQEHIDALLSNHKPEFDQVAAELDAFNSSILDVAEQAGLIDPAKRAAWEHSDYIPFYRVREGGFSGPGGKKGIAGQSSGINKLTGGAEALNDPLANLAQNAAHLLDAAMKNHAMAQVTENLEGSDFMEKQPNIAYKKDIMPRSQVRTILKDAGMSKEELKLIPRAALDGFAEIWSIKPPDGSDVVRVMRGGKAEYYKVKDEALLRGLTAVNQEAFGGVVAVMRGFKRLLTTMVTSEPTFMARNFVRDAVHAWTINEDGFTLGVDSIKGAAKSLREEGGMVDMLFAGASFMGGFVNANDPKAMADAIRRGLREKGFKRAQEDSYMGTLVHGSKDLWAAYQHIGDAIENANRETVYEAGTKSGKSKAQRIYEARDLMDYSMRGNFAAIRLLGDVLPFFNARLQGLYKLGRAGAIPGPGMKREIIAKGGMIAVASIALAMLNGDREEYEELPDWDKDSNWHIFVGRGRQEIDGPNHYRIPKPFELGLLFGTIPERIARNMMGNDDGGRTAERFLWALTSTLEVNPFPQAIRPLAEVWANEDMFTKRPIENMADEGVLPSARYNERTSDTMRVLSDLFGDETGLGPKRLEHLWTGYMGTLGSYMLAVTDMLTREAQGKPVKADARVDDIPVLKAFVRGNVARGTQYQIDFYDALREVRQTWTTVRRFAKEGRMVEAKELLADNADTIKYRKFLETKQKQLRALRKAQDLISRDPDMTGAQKRKRTDELQRQINQTSRHAVRVIDDKTY